MYIKCEISKEQPKDMLILGVNDIEKWVIPYLKKVSCIQAASLLNEITGPIFMNPPNPPHHSHPKHYFLKGNLR